MENTSYSHPENPVRHSYPVKSKEEGFGAAVNLCLKTMPYMLMRIGILLAFLLVAIIWISLCAGVAYLFSGKDGQGGGGIVLFLIGVGLPAGLFAWARKYVLYVLKLGHVAVITKLITEGELPAGINQVEYGKKIVTDRFTQTNILFVVDSLVTGVANAFNRTLDWVTNLLPIPGMDSIQNVVHKIVDNATTFIDETVFSYNLARGDENVWRSSGDGLVYYAANAKAILKTAVTALVIEYAITAGMFVICLLPAVLIGKLLPSAVASWAWIIAVALAGAIRSAVLHPIFLTMVALTFHKNVENQAIDEKYNELLTSASNKFIELRDKARDYMASGKKEVTV